ncbi:MULTISPECIES: RagB/SusD family nutrient uptake outer membrane protein [Flavobacteriaceae]|uniref:RagB/SusD family nutrient uptake outer membrane protein n=1 Tax=Flavobacteriaceae TaxID=49546 RepID=UPI0014921647|nr:MULTISPECIES: RagB/SusD family nutrient uptake outer membrane protein [Allomuricauda]MDC6367533.1 RagB/SusD family nutrient uptake outer membrane protein [Muricauda sp. AC10]
MKRIIIYITIITFVAVGCTRDNYLDFVPKGKKVPSTTDDYRELLDQVGKYLSSGTEVFSYGFGEMHFRSLFYTDDVNMTQEIVLSLGYSDIAFKTYLFSESHIPQSESDADWENYYHVIYIANVILDGLENVDGTDAEIAELRAEAKIQRAWAYLHLVNQYALHYNSATASTDLGVPIRKGVALTGLDLTRASVQEVYDYLIDDITSDMDALPDTQSTDLRFRPSKAVANALLARTYLFQGKYQEALTAADKALASHSDLNDYNDLINDEDRVALPEDIVDNTEIVWYKSTTNSFFIASPVFITQELFDLYEDDDLRKKQYAEWTDYSPNDDFGLINATIEEAISPCRGLTTPELYLISAECNARLGNTGTALNRLNELRVTRYDSGTYQDVEITDPISLLDFIKAERRRELYKSNVRLFDIKRYNQFDNDQISVTHSYNGETVTLAPNSLNWAFPIGQAYIDYNPEIEQNPRD